MDKTRQIGEDEGCLPVEQAAQEEVFVPSKDIAEADTTKETAFAKHLKKVSEMVETWPKWEQKILGVASMSPYEEELDNE